MTKLEIEIFMESIRKESLEDPFLYRSIRELRKNPDISVLAKLIVSLVSAKKELTETIVKMREAQCAKCCQNERKDKKC